MGTFPVLGAVGIAGGVAWYLAYGRSRTERTDAVQVLANR
jgi:APA family basic amino acid/polyamine antiporter